MEVNINETFMSNKAIIEGAQHTCVYECIQPLLSLLQKYGFF